MWAQGRYRMLCGGTDGMAHDRKSHGRIRMDEEGYLCAEFAPEIGTDEKKRHYTKTLALSDQANLFWKRLRRIDGADFRCADAHTREFSFFLPKAGLEYE